MLEYKPFVFTQTHADIISFQYMQGTFQGKKKIKKITERSSNPVTTYCMNVVELQGITHNSLESHLDNYV